MTLDSKAQAYRRIVRNMLDAVAGWVDGTSRIAWEPSQGILPLVRSSVIKRQHEFLGIAIDLTEKNQGFAAVGFLRPACEEYLWAKYLASIPKEDADRFLFYFARKELWDSLRIQDKHVGKEAMERLGLEDFFRRVQATEKSIKSNIKDLGNKLNWDRRTIENAKIPSMAFIANKVDEKKLYDLLYHASSRYVHFSPTEIMRRAWGRSGSISVSSSHFSDYWGSFVLYWGAFLLAKTYSAINSLGEPSDSEIPIDAHLLLEASTALAELGPVPIITASELNWP